MHNPALFTAVIVGVLDEAIATAREQLAKKADQLRSFEQIEWSRAELDHWVAVEAYEGALRAIEGGDPATAFYAALRAKQAVADLAETALLRITRVLGGGTFSQRSPFAHWFEDVRALGFLRPPWALAYDTLFATSIDELRSAVAEKLTGAYPARRHGGPAVRPPGGTARRVHHRLQPDIAEILEVTCFGRRIESLRHLAGRLVDTGARHAWMDERAGRGRAARADERGNVESLHRHRSRSWQEIADRLFDLSAASRTR